MPPANSDNTSVTARPLVGSYTTPGLSEQTGQEVARILQGRLNALNDLALTLKHVHWNVVGPHFIGVHEMIDPHVVEVRDMVDETAERIATLGTAPLGTPGEIVASRTWQDYSLGRGSTDEHLGALDVVYVGLLEDHRKAQETTADLDPVSEDMLIGQIKQLELFHWFIRAHLENAGGGLSTGSATSEESAAEQAGARH
ncbi:DNA starvation/stationary phase protection protein [soil metagenome]